ncbi:PEP-CTERM sorting domain-containing protein [Opitutaceae bacterium TAV4]|nr:PEP-CTERM sorting domain-containing protein [Opitutaceae bacterium TAV4]RRJ99128.1 PEP-CTERM sorting domain-containing protein [Opitutaceae bacterium TAV3]
MKTPRIHTLITAASIPLAFFLLTLTARALTVSSIALLPTSGVNIDHSTGVSDGVTTSNGITARYFAADNQRSLDQTFIWNSDLNMSGLGLLVAADQNTVSGKRFTTSQSYYLDIQRLDDSNSSRKVEETIITVQFTLTTDLVRAGHYLYIAFTTPLSLTNGTAYGFNLRPGEIVNANAVSIDLTAVPYADGAGGQGGTVSILANGTAYTKSGSNYDFAFFTTTAAVPEPATTVASLGTAAISLGILLRRRR